MSRIFLIALLALTGCVGDSRPQLAALIAACRLPRASDEQWRVHPASNTFNRVSDACATQIEAAFHVEQETFQHPLAVVWRVKERLYEAIQVLMSTPVRLASDGRVFPMNLSDTSGRQANPAGWMPQGLLCWVDPEAAGAEESGVSCPGEFLNARRFTPDPRFIQAERLLAMLKERISTFRFVPSALAGNNLARSTLHDLRDATGVVAVTELFAPMQDRNPMVTHRYLRAAILVHELMHQEVGPHITCPEGPSRGAGNCDETLYSSYGMEMAYVAGLVRASQDPAAWQGMPPMTAQDLEAMAFAVCIWIRDRRIVRIPAALQRYFAEHSCNDLNADFWTQH